jgi:molybdopterin-guanine dinucleotide biosynthesis protein
MALLKIAVSGAHSTGKSTFLTKLKAALQAQGVSCLTVSDLATKCRLPILEEHTIESTLWIVASGIAGEISAAHESRIALVDRPVVDAWAYLMAGKNASTLSKSSAGATTLRNIIRDWSPTYDIIFHTVLDENIAVEDNKGRVLDAGYRSKVASEMNLAYGEFSVQGRPLTSSNAPSELEWALQQVSERVRSLS